VINEPNGITGDVLVRAPWLSAGYDRLFRTEADARPVDQVGHIWHRTGDVGHIDSEGRLWIEGRSVHLVHTAEGPVTPVPMERSVERDLGIIRSAAVGVGPVGCQALVIVVEMPGGDGLTDPDIAAQVRRVVQQPVAAVLRRKALPVDIRHNAKIDRAAVARWAAELLAGRSS
jgi:olefin beta-lactone synthetase